MRAVLVLSHLRSGSTLLCHLLNGHPRICGYGESFTCYRGPEDFLELVTRIARVQRRLRVSEEVFVDKLLYHELLPQPELLDDRRVFRLFLLREPHGTLSSTSARVAVLRAGAAGSRSYVEALARYYRQRLAELAGYARGRSDTARSFFLTHDQLLHRTAEVFAGLERWLDLPEPLSETYPLLRTTGRAAGDRSPQIRAGRILRDYERHAADVPAEIEAAAAAAFERCRVELAEHCLTVGDA